MFLHYEHVKLYPRMPNIVGNFYAKNFRTTNTKKFRIQEQRPTMSMIFTVAIESLQQNFPDL